MPLLHLQPKTSKNEVNSATEEIMTALIHLMFSFQTISEHSIVFLRLLEGERLECYPKIIVIPEQVVNSIMQQIAKESPTTAERNRESGWPSLNHEKPGRNLLESP